LFTEHFFKIHIHKQENELHTYMDQTNPDGDQISQTLLYLSTGSCNNTIWLS